MTWRRCVVPDTKAERIRRSNRMALTVVAVVVVSLFVVWLGSTLILRTGNAQEHNEPSFPELGGLIAEIDTQERQSEWRREAAQRSWIEPHGGERRQPRLSDVPDRRAIKNMSRDEKDELLLWLGRGPDWSRALFHLHPGMNVYYGYQAKAYDHTILAVSGDRITTRHKTGEVIEKSIRLYEDWPCYVKNEDLRQ